MSHPHAELGMFPTPVQPAPRLATAIGLRPDDLWIKRDDLTGLGGGGNKVRKLEWTVGAALDDGADTLVTTGAPQSNHAQLTAAAGARAGLDVVLVLRGSPGNSRSGNLALDGLLGARLAWAGDVDQDGLNRAATQVCSQLRSRGARPALIPFGGSSTRGARGYVQCGQELRRQIPGLRTAVVALGSGGTMAGLVASLGTQAVLGVDVGALADPAAAACAFAGPLTAAAVSPQHLRVRRDQVGSGYGALTAPVSAALTLAARCEGLVLDPVYTGRALAGLIAAVRDGDVKPGEKTVFIHTGGLPGLFGHAQALAYAEDGAVVYVS
ncbi:cysteine desulfhydrase [Streptomyces rimosus subsp. pseudoverticillatus]|uniref:pyridoxal-phosphate dependent enzyme n=1 Tax=Streptomyces rimosus TaxID=1927 RepID=UPI0006B2808B|nr:pyridoxal-phosphate dependent enzyme [Streptomyces rimosus]KOT84722.1 cysteine desulfhydrase [Streptomyces rimosus subsp. pseudoverticillatus]